VQDVRSPLHDPHIQRSRILELAVRDGVHEPVVELLLGSEKVSFHELNHAMIWNAQVVTTMLGRNNALTGRTHILSSCSAEAFR